MPDKIQAVPRGLLSGLNIVGSGDNIRALADDLRATMDAEPYYYASKLETVTAGNAAAVNYGDAVILTVPSNEYWLVVAACTSIQIAVGRDGAINLAYQRTSTSVPVLLDSAVIAPPVATAVLVAAQVSRQPMLFSPDTRLVGVLRSTLAAATNLFISAEIVRLTY
jgi:hypothetical protein